MRKNEIPNAAEVRKVAELLRSTQTQIKEILKDAQGMQYLSDLTCDQIRTIERRLYGIVGLQMDNDPVSNLEFKPLQKIMGIAVDIRKPIKDEDLQPTKTEKEKLRERIMSFYEEMQGMLDDKVLEVLHEPDGVAVLRGAAKLADVKNWREGELNILFVQEIKLGYASQFNIKKALEEVEENASLPTDEEVIKQSIAEEESDVQGGDEVEKLGIDFGDSLAEEKSDDTTGLKEETETEIRRKEAKRMRDEGFTNKDIAHELKVSVQTVSNYLK